MGPLVIVVKTGLDSGFLKHLKKLQKSKVGSSIRIFESLASALSAIQEAGFQTDGLLFIGADMAVDDGIMDLDRIIWIIDWKTKREAEAEAEMKGFSRWIFPDTQLVNATIILFSDLSGSEV